MHLLEWDFGSGRWEPRAIPESGVELGDGTARALPVVGGGCALLVRCGVRVNGESPLPLQVLVNRAEIRVAGRTFYATDDAPPEPDVFHDVGRRVNCARCQGTLVEGDAVVRCPSGSCRAFAHQACWFWEQAPGCQKCGHPPGELGWQPELMP
jgi:hypothetical protein